MDGHLSVGLPVPEASSYDSDMQQAKDLLKSELRAQSRKNNDAICAIQTGHYARICAIAEKHGR